MQTTSEAITDDVFDALSQDLYYAFIDILQGEGCYANRRNLKTLAKRGLIGAYEETWRNDAGKVMQLTRWTVPVHVHIAWSRWYESKAKRP